MSCGNDKKGDQSKSLPSMADANYLTIFPASLITMIDVTTIEGQDSYGQ